MAYIETWIKENRQARTADKVVDLTLQKLKERSRTLDKYAPMTTKSGRQWLAYLTEQINPIASLVSTGQEYPATKKGRFNQVQTNMFKAALRHEWSEDLQWRMKEIKEFASARGITVQNIAVGDGKVAVGADNSLAELIFGTVAALVRGHINLLDYLAWQVLQTGKLIYTDSRTGLDINLDWTKVYPALKNHFPAALTGTRRWTDLENADGLQDLVDMHYTYKYSNGFAADEIAISEQLLHLLLRQQSTKEAVVQSMSVGYMISGTPSLEQLNEVMKRRMLPPFVLVDDHFELDGDNTGNNVPSRFLDPTRVVFLKKGMAERVLGETLENKGKAGIYQNTRQEKAEPPLDITYTASMMIVTAPTISRYGMARQVCDPVDLESSMHIEDFALD